LSTSNRLQQSASARGRQINLRNVTVMTAFELNPRRVTTFSSAQKLCSALVQKSQMNHSACGPHEGDGRNFNDIFLQIAVDFFWIYMSV